MGMGIQCKQVSVQRMTISHPCIAMDAENVLQWVVINRTYLYMRYGIVVAH